MNEKTFQGFRLKGRPDLSMKNQRVYLPVSGYEQFIAYAGQLVRNAGFFDLAASYKQTKYDEHGRTEPQGVGARPYRRAEQDEVAVSFDHIADRLFVAVTGGFPNALSYRHAKEETSKA